MNDWRTQLREFDPAHEAPEPGRFDAMRTVVVEAARAADVVRSPWPRRLAFATVALALVAGGAGDVGFDPFAPAQAVIGDPEPAGQRRQVQFATPGGTRIIWELNPEFRLTETLP
jgi:hypothetical protein